MSFLSSLGDRLSAMGNRFMDTWDTSKDYANDPFVSQMNDSLAKMGIKDKIQAPEGRYFDPNTERGRYRTNFLSNVTDLINSGARSGTDQMNAILSVYGKGPIEQGGMRNYAREAAKQNALMDAQNERNMMLANMNARYNNNTDTANYAAGRSKVVDLKQGLTNQIYGGR